jgi:hypothetical protein
VTHGVGHGPRTCEYDYDVDLCECIQPLPCGDITFEGECDGDVLTWCQNDQLLTFDCSNIDRSCAFTEAAGNDCI